MKNKLIRLKISFHNLLHFFREITQSAIREILKASDILEFDTKHNARKKKSKIDPSHYRAIQDCFIESINYRYGLNRLLAFFEDTTNFNELLKQINYMIAGKCSPVAIDPGILTWKICLIRAAVSFGFQFDRAVLKSFLKYRTRPKRHGGY